MKQFTNKWCFKKKRECLFHFNWCIEKKIGSSKHKGNFVIFEKKSAQWENLDNNFKSK